MHGTNIALDQKCNKQLACNECKSLDGTVEVTLMVDTQIVVRVERNLSKRGDVSEILWMSNHEVTVLRCSTVYSDGICYKKVQVQYDLHVLA